MSDLEKEIVRLENVELTLESRAGPVEILRGISLNISEGSSVAIVGPSGSGKTSLLMVLAGLEPATSGNVFVAGHDFAKLDEDALALARGQDIGIVFQSFHLVPTMTAVENVALPLEFRGDSQPSETAMMLLNEVGLSNRTDHFPAQLSGGEQQRVALARALATEPKLILADEPTGNLDGKTSDTVTELLFDLHKKSGTTLILITHDETLAARCHRTVRMRDGKIESITNTDAAMASDAEVAAE